MERKVILTREGLQIPCLVTEPDFGEIRRVVLGVHGLGGSMHDEIQESISQEMDLFYSATIRFDFPCHGESPVEEPLSLHNCRNSLLAAAEYARDTFPQVEDLCVFATGFGAYITLICLEELLEMPGKVKLVVQTPSLRLHETLLSMKNLNRETLWAMDQFTFKGERPIVITYSFYEEVAQNVALTSYPIPMLILHGEEDAYIRQEDIRQFARINEQSKLVIIPGASHRFQEDGAWDMVLDLTRDWFEFEKVLIDVWDE